MTAGDSGGPVAVGRHGAGSTEPPTGGGPPASGAPAIALNGTTGPDWLRAAAAFRPVALALDADEAGDAAADALGASPAFFGARLERWRPPAKDWNQALRDVGLEVCRVVPVAQQSRGGDRRSRSPRVTLKPSEDAAAERGAAPAPSGAGELEDRDPRAVFKAEPPAAGPPPGLPAVDGYCDVHGRLLTYREFIDGQCCWCHPEDRPEWRDRPDIMAALARINAERVANLDE